MTTRVPGVTQLASRSICALVRTIHPLVQLSRRWIAGTYAAGIAAPTSPASSSIRAEGQRTTQPSHLRAAPKGPGVDLPYSDPNLFGPHVSRYRGSKARGRAAPGGP
jgi:hypothetical protein